MVFVKKKWLFTIDFIAKYSKNSTLTYKPKKVLFIKCINRNSDKSFWITM